MKLTRSDSSLRLTSASWLWGALGFPLAAFFAWQLVAYVGQADHLRVIVAILLGALLAGGVGLLLTRWSDFTFDRTDRMLHWKRVGVVRWAGGSISFDRIRFAVVQFMPGKGVGEPDGFYRVALCTDEGIIPLTMDYSGGPSNDERCRFARMAINELLGVRLESEDDHDIRELDRSGNRAWAIRFLMARYVLDTNAAYARLEGLLGKTAAERAA